MSHRLSPTYRCIYHALRLDLYGLKNPEIIKWAWSHLYIISDAAVKIPGMKEKKAKPRKDSQDRRKRQTDPVPEICLGWFVNTSYSKSTQDYGYG